MKFKKTALSTVATVFALSLVVSTVSAHEIYSTAPSRWQHKSVDGYLLKLQTNDDNLGAPYNNGNYSNAVSKWTASSSPVLVSDTSFSTSNVDLGTPTTTFWNSLGIPTTAAAVTINFDTNGSRMLTQAEAEASNKQINYSNIWFNPDSSYAGSTELVQNKTVVHEMGHVMGLGHPVGYSGTSVMFQGVLSYDTPQPHEESDIRSYYGL